jgi:hypothetical protein
MGKHTRDNTKQYLGKQVVVTLRSGTKYEGIYYTYSKEDFVLIAYSPLMENGGMKISPDVQRKRYFRFTKLAAIVVSASQLMAEAYHERK